jgi:hypothetical protein
VAAVSVGLLGTGAAVWQPGVRAQTAESLSPVAPPPTKVTVEAAPANANPLVDLRVSVAPEDALESRLKRIEDRLAKLEERLAEKPTNLNHTTPYNLEMVPGTGYQRYMPVPPPPQNPTDPRTTPTVPLGRANEKGDPLRPPAQQGYANGLTADPKPIAPQAAVKPAPGPPKDSKDITVSHSRIVSVPVGVSDAYKGGKQFGLYSSSDKGRTWRWQSTIIGLPPGGRGSFSFRAPADGVYYLRTEAFPEGEDPPQQLSAGEPQLTVLVDTRSAQDPSLNDRIKRLEDLLTPKQPNEMPR